MAENKSKLVIKKDILRNRFVKNLKSKISEKNSENMIENEKELKNMKKINKMLRIKLNKTKLYELYKKKLVSSGADFLWIDNNYHSIWLMIEVRDEIERRRNAG